MTSKPTLTDMPKVAINIILTKVDFRSILTLRNVCWDLRNFIDDVKPEASIRHLNISINLESIEMFMPHDRLSVEYKAHGKGCETFCNTFQKPKMFENKDFPTVFMEDLQTILRFLKSAEELHISFKLTTEDPIENQEFITNQFLEIMKQSLKSRLRPLLVQKLNIGTVTQNEVMSVLPYLDAKTLESIDLVNCGCATFHTLEMDKIVELDQWKNAKKLVMFRLICSTPIQHFYHFSNISIFYETVTNDILLLKQMVLLDSNFSSTLDTFRITFKTCNRAQLRSFLGEPIVSDMNTWILENPAKQKSFKFTLSHFSLHWSLYITQA